MIPNKSSCSCWPKLELLIKKREKKMEGVHCDFDGRTAVITTKSVKYSTVTYAGGTAKLLPSDVYIDKIINK